MTGLSMIGAGVVCPGFGMVSDEPAESGVLGLPPHDPFHGDLTVELPEQDPAYVKPARDHTAATLRMWDLDFHIPDATLVVSELVTNAMRHAPPPGAAAAWPILLRLVRRDRTVMCMVADSSDRPPVLMEPDNVAETGRGMHLVAAHSDRWNWARRRHKPGKWVWVVLSPSSDASW